MVEEVRLQIDLTIGDGDHVGRNVSRYIACLCLNDRQCGERAATFDMTFHRLRQIVHLLSHLLLLVDLSGTLQQTGVEVEHVTRISLTS